MHHMKVSHTSDLYHSHVLLLQNEDDDARLGLCKRDLCRDSFDTCRSNSSSLITSLGVDPADPRLWETEL